MNEGKKSHLNRTFLLISAFAVVLLFVGFILIRRMNTLLTTYSESQTRRQAESFASQEADRLATELENLAYIAGRIEAHPEELDLLMPVVYDDDTGVRQGLVSIDGEVLYGDDLSLQAYEGINTAFRGTRTITYVSGQCLLFACPVYNGPNVRYVLYKLFPPQSLEEPFALSVYDDLGKVCVINRDGEIIIPISNGSAEDNAFIRSSTVRNNLRQLQMSMDVSVAAARTFETIRGDMVLFEAEIPGTDFLLAGFVPMEKASEGIKSITLLVLWVFGLLMLLVMAGTVYLLSAQVKIRESDELREAKAAAEEASRAKSDFLANMSHEIRTPINAVLGMDELIIRETHEEQTKQYALDIRRAGNTLLSLINDILDFSKIEAGKMELVADNYDLALLVADLSDMMRPRMLARGLYFNVSVGNDIPRYLCGDSVRLKQCMLNILTNACKYTNKGGVDFSLTLDGREDDEVMIRVTVTDTGIGIRKEDIERLYSAFDRIDEKRNKSIEGTGLGMNIVNSLLDKMGSHIEVESEYGVGSTFSFAVKQKVVRDVRVGDFEAAAHIAAEEDSRYKRSFMAPNAHILIVDDNRMNLMVAVGLLRETRVKADTALSGEEALELMKHNIYDVLLIDHMMPNMSGIELLKKLKEDVGNPNSRKPCIVLTANAVAGARDRYIKDGFDDYLSKPVAGKDLERVMLMYLPDHLIEDVTEDAAGDQAEEELAPELKADLDLIGGLEEIDLEKGLSVNASPEAYLAVVKVFHESVSEQTKDLTEFFNNGDLKNYTIKVHALKSSLRIIGAAALGEEAQLLENAGKAGDQEYIMQRNDRFLASCLALGGKLDPVCREEEDESKPEADSRTLEEAYRDIENAAANMDIDMLDEVFERLEKYRIPAEEKEYFESLRKAYSQFEYETIRELIAQKNVVK